MRFKPAGPTAWAIDIFAAIAVLLLSTFGTSEMSRAQATGDVASVKPDAAAPATKSATGKAIDAVKSVAKSASDIFSRVPCSTPKDMKFEASLPHVARKIAAGEHVSIIAFGSSSTASFGASSPAFQYPNRLADQLRRRYPNADISVMNQGIGGEDTPEMMKRLKTSVIDQKPDLVIWQLGTNTVIRGGDIDETMGMLEDGIKRLKAIDADIVLVDPQYVPATTAAREKDSDKMVGVIGRAARVMKVGVFPRFAVMKEWHNDRKIPFDDFVIKDGLHMNDWGYACFAQLLGDSIIKSVDRVQAGVEVPSHVLTFRPM
ncbi:SGNH/GDSL hydrolase family protein [Bradyrhizobium prioriisuperbiae]|uniref:SGNH/GDSL hydrolase family protein n=1 Tax=Bradyrhizobium prioriisuperbiae TaxID=2854389 RepID=UPI0028E6EFF0|nr:SGNH/GDSL hydrolase family protein [Bradyrhizobium prioritasuperba]